MESFIKADIFFFVSTVSVIIFTVLICILSFYLIRAGRNLHSISEIIKDEINESKGFALELKDRLENNMFFRLVFPVFRKRTNKDKK